jgi:small GTP-binding protein
MENQRYKVILIGESGIGKTTLVQRYHKGYVDREVSSTIGMAFSTTKIRLGTTMITLEIWDSAGQERFNSIVPLYFKNADAILCCYDIHNPNSQYQLLNRWILCIQDFFGEKFFCIFLVGTKLDLTKVEDQIYVEESVRNIVKKTKKKLGIDPDDPLVNYLTSSITGENVQQLFQEVAYTIYQNKNPIKKESTSSERIKVLKSDTDNSIIRNCCI